jgi:hypothetical protein
MTSLVIPTFAITNFLFKQVSLSKIDSADTWIHRSTSDG